MNITYIRDVSSPVFARYGVKRAAVFGSAARGQETAKSDVDFLVELPPNISLFDLVSLKNDLEDLLKAPVDLVEYNAIKPSLKPHILGNEISIYSA